MAQVDDGMHQRIINKAYDLWNDDDSWDAFLLKLDVAPRDAVVIGKFNYQVENGGFHQWFDNGYGEKAETLLSALSNVGTGLATEVLKLVEQALKVYENRDTDEDEEADYDDGYRAELNKLDSAYYMINSRFMEECEVYFTGKAPS